MSNIYLYADESGNTGTNLFDNSQPYFYMATLFSPIDIDKNEQFKNDFMNILNNENELHFNDLDKNNLTIISEQILQLFEHYNITSLLTIIEKKYLPKIHFFNTFFDSGLNPKVPSNMYQQRMHRFIALAIVLEDFTDSDAKTFYSLIEDEDYIEISNFINKIQKKVIQNESEELTNILNPIFEFAKQKPQECLSNFNKKELLPNFFVLPLIMEHTIKTYPNKKAIFKHDYNSKIFKGMNHIIDIACNYKMNDDAFGSFAHMTKNNIFSNGIQFIDSKNSLGIQLSDFVVSFAKAHHEDKIDTFSCTKMCEYIEQTSMNGVGQDFTNGELKSYEQHIK
ncbi:MAG: hypothetical protein C0626_07080 [Arcobacter sp.]|uniref:DUF3800 domain-containing protein n=1 Tax=uncultured Arcobacter sp. TaxID=165434 RepID=UPI000CAB47FA|nr:DUF3800 domain-containing protein [uncultured Arcobacter sp.]PLY10034.1 MAG: hypothetical protein C0626_07080 [Arcobacter sp.]